MSIRNILDGTIKVGSGSELEVKKLVATDFLACPAEVRLGEIIAHTAEVKGNLAAGGVIADGHIEAQNLEVYNETRLHGTLTLNDKPVLREFVETANLNFTLTLQNDTTMTITSETTYSLTSVGERINMFGFFTILKATSLPKKITVTAPVPTYNNIWKAYNYVPIRTDNAGTLQQATCITEAFGTRDGIDIDLRFTQATEVSFLVIKLDILIH